MLSRHLSLDRDPALRHRAHVVRPRFNFRRQRLSHALSQLWRHYVRRRGLQPGPPSVTTDGYIRPTRSTRTRPATLGDCVSWSGARGHARGVDTCGCPGQSGAVAFRPTTNRHCAAHVLVRHAHDTTACRCDNTGCGVASTARTGYPPFRPDGLRGPSTGGTSGRDAGCSTAPRRLTETSRRRSTCQHWAMGGARRSRRPPGAARTPTGRSTARRCGRARTAGVTA